MSFFVCVCACVCGVEGGRLSEKIRHQMLLYKQNIRDDRLLKEIFIQVIQARNLLIMATTQ